MLKERLTRTKTFMPAQPQHSVMRKEPLAKFRDALSREAVFVIAPAGYGKTMLAQQWNATIRSSESVGWLSLDESDANPQHFYGYLAAALSDCGFAPNGKTTHMLTAGNAPHLDSLLACFAEEVEGMPRRAVLFLDDYHRASSPEVDAFVKGLVNMRLENFCLVVMSRPLHTLPLSRWQINDQIGIIDQTDLKLSEEETAYFLQSSTGKAWQPEDARAAWLTSEGWIAGLKLITLAIMSERNPSAAISPSLKGLPGQNSSRRFLWNYLWEELFASQDQHTRDFLMATSVADELNASLCDALMETWRSLSETPPTSKEPPAPNAAEIIRYLETEGLFLVNLDNAGYWFRYHHLMREFAVHQMSLFRPQAKDALMRKASEWHAAHGHESQAARYAIACNDYAYAAGVIEKIGLNALANGQASSIAEWINALPQPIVRENLVLGILRSWGYALSVQGSTYREALYGISVIEEAAKRCSEADFAMLCEGHIDLMRIFLKLVPRRGHPPLIDASFVKHALQLPHDAHPFPPCFMAFGWSHLAHNQAREAMDDLLKARLLAFDAPHLFSAEESSFCLCLIYSAQGLAGKALELCENDIARFEELGQSEHIPDTLAGPLHIMRGHLLLQQGKTTAAEKALEIGFSKVSDCVIPYYQYLGCVAMFELRELQGRSLEALDYLDRMEKAWPDAAFAANALRAEHHLQASSLSPSSLATLEDLVSDADPRCDGEIIIPGMGPLQGALLHYRSALSWARVMIRAGKAAEAIPFLERASSAYRASGLVRRAITIDAVLAFAYQALGNESRALDLFVASWKTRPDEGSFGSMVLGCDFTELYRKAAMQGLVDRSQNLEQANRRNACAPCDSASASGMLSQREIEVLLMVGQGFSNKSIAGSLCLEVSTVKQHMNRIMRKLAAKNRTEAFVKAKHLGFL